MTLTFRKVYRSLGDFNKKLLDRLVQLTGETTSQLKIGKEELRIPIKYTRPKDK